MINEMKEEAVTSLGGMRIQKAGEDRSPESSRFLNSGQITKNSTNRLELRKKINHLIRLEAEQKYIGSTNRIEPAFDTANLKYLASERGRNFGKEPSREFQKEVLIKMLNRRNHLDSVFSKSRTTPEMSLLIEV
jgi:hypothetical protein